MVVASRLPATTINRDHQKTVRTQKLAVKARRPIKTGDGGD